MKKVLFVIICFSVFGLKAQNNNDGGPKAVAYEWLVDVYHENYDKAKELSTEETKEVLATIPLFTLPLPDSLRRQGKHVIITIKDCKIERDKAIVKFIASDYPTKIEELHLIKKDEKWLVQFSKNDLNSEPQEDKAKHKSVKH